MHLSVYSAGLNCYGQCGVQPTVEGSQPFDEPLQLHRIPHLPGKTSRVGSHPTPPSAAEYSALFVDPLALHSQVCCGLDHTLFLTAGGSVLACGWSADGQTGESAEVVT